MLAHGLLSCVSAVFVVCSSGLWGGVGGGGGGLITSSLHTSHGTACEFYVVPPKTLHTSVTDSLPARK